MLQGDLGVLHSLIFMAVLKAFAGAPQEHLNSGWMQVFIRLTDRFNLSICQDTICIISY